MYNIQKINPLKWQDSPILCQYINDLPDKPYCSDVKNFCHIRTKKHAIKHAYIQPNHPARVSYIILDIDHPDGIHAALYDTDLPPPHLIVQNKKNCHVHLVWRVINPIYMWGKARSAPIRLLARVERGMVLALGADTSYGSNLMKNPINDAWYTYTTDAPLEGYSLSELGRFVSLDDIATTEASEAAGYGRNCTLFDHLRHYGYNESTASYSALVSYLTPIANQLNQQFAVSLHDPEVMGIVRSIARYCTRTDFTASHRAFSELQSIRSQYRWGDSTDKQIQAQIWASEGVKIGVIAERLNISPRTLTRWGIQKKIK